MRTLLIFTIILCVLGLLFVFESSTTEGLNTFGDQYYFLRRQSIGLGIGFGALIFGLLMPTTFWKKTAPFVYAGAIFLLLLVFVPGIGREFNGAHRWISLLGITVLQPIEVAKLGIVIGLAHWLSKHQRIAPFVLLTGIPLGLVVLQPDLGSALLLAAICGGMYFLSGGKMSWIFAVGSTTIALAALLIILLPYRTERVLTFINPERDPLGASFHIRQITLALGRGGWIGQGIGNSRQKVAFIPEPSTDSIFAITAEEIGFLGSTIVIALYLGYISIGWKIASKQVEATQNEKAVFRYLLAGGITIWIGMQTILNLAAVVALVPLTGMPLPFFSYGSSSLVMVLLATGILAKIDSQKQTKKQRK
jgi:cell division protein FtsW